MKVLEIFLKDPEVDTAAEFHAKDIVIQDWVRDACKECSYIDKSWSCPPGVGSLEKSKKRISGYSKAVFVRLKSSKNRKAIENSVISLESKLKESFPRVIGFFVSPCTACSECKYPEECVFPDKCRPTGESWGIDLLETSRKTGLLIKLVKNGEEFKPVTLFLLK